MSREATVHSLHPEPDAPRQVPAIGMSLVMNLGGDRQATLQCFVAQEDGEEAANQLLDRMFRIGDRQKARYDLEGLEKELGDNVRQLAQFQENYDNVEKTYALKRIERETESQGYSERAETIFRQGYENHVASGRRGAYKPQGRDEQQIAVARKAAAGLDAALKTDEAERAQALQAIEKTKDRYHAEIARLSGEIERRLAVLGLPTRANPEPDGA